MRCNNNFETFFYEMTLNHSIKAHKERTPANKSMPYVSVNLTRTLTELMLGFVHDMVCHKYNFIKTKTGANTQDIKAFNNSPKLDIKKRKGVKKELR